MFFFQISVPRLNDHDETTPLSTSSSSRRGSGRGRGRCRGGGGGSGSRRGGSSSAKVTPRKPFNKEKYFKQKTLQESIQSSCFEEDETTRMSADIPMTPKSTGLLSSLIEGNGCQLPSLTLVPLETQDSVSQSSHLSSASVTMDGSASNQTPSMSSETRTSVRRRGKMEMVGTLEGRAEFTVDMLAEYDWPPATGCCPKKNRDTYMIQEQVAEYLGVKSFKRKYPDLERRTVEMEERDYLIERGMVTEKLCDLGVTAVFAVDVLDIMYQDFHDKYEAYKVYHREKIARDISLRQRMQKSEGGQGAREKALRSMSNWNSNLNKT